MSVATLNRSDRKHSDLFVVTAPDSLSGFCIAMGSIAETEVCLYRNPKQACLSRFHMSHRRTGQNVPPQPPPPGPG